MVTDILKKFDMNLKVEFFVEYFQNMVELYGNNSDDFCVIDLHSLINMIIEELSKNNINRNLKFFYEKLQEIKKQDLIVKKHYSYKVNEIVSNIFSKKEYTLIVAKSLLSDINNGKYAKNVCDRIIKILFDSTSLEESKDELKYLTNVLIVEFIIYGYNEEYLIKIMKNIFSTYAVYSDGLISTDFPLPCEISMNEIVKYMESLTIKNRIESLKNYFEKHTKKYYYLFKINGIVGDNLNIHLNNVDIYNWRNFHKFDIEKDEKIKNSCYAYKNGKFEENDIHCSICIEALDFDGVFEKIKQQLDEAFDILYTYHNINCKIEIDYTDYLVFDDNKNIIREGFTRIDDENFMRLVSPLNYNLETNITELNEYYSNYSKYILNNSNVSSEIIKNSIRYYRKGKETSKTEDKILNYWISIENLLKIDIDLPSSIIENERDDLKFRKIVGLVPTLICKLNIVNCYWQVFNYFYDRSLYNPEILDEETKRALQFSSEKQDLTKFINNYKLLKDKFSTALDIEIYEKYEKILDNRGLTEDFIKHLMSNTKNILLLSYRYRNMIVHNAQCDSTFIRFYANQLAKIAINLIGIIINEIYKKETNIDLKNIIISKYIEQKQEIKSLEVIALRDWLINLGK